MERVVPRRERAPKKRARWFVPPGRHLPVSRRDSGARQLPVIYLEIREKEGLPDG